MQVEAASEIKKFIEEDIVEGEEENVEVLQRKKIKKPTLDSIQNTDTTIHDVTQTGNPDAVIINPDIS